MGPEETEGDNVYFVCGFSSLFVLVRIFFFFNYSLFTPACCLSDLVTKAPLQSKLSFFSPVPLSRLVVVLRNPPVVPTVTPSRTFPGPRVWECQRELTPLPVAVRLGSLEVAEGFINIHSHGMRTGPFLKLRALLLLPCPLNRLAFSMPYKTCCLRWVIWLHKPSFLSLLPT